MFKFARDCPLLNFFLSIIHYFSSSLIPNSPRDAGCLLALQVWLGREVTNVKEMCSHPQEHIL